MEGRSDGLELRDSGKGMSLVRSLLMVLFKFYYVVEKFQDSTHHHTLS